MAERYVSALTGPEMDAALLDMAQHNSEAWAVGTRNGAAVSSSDDTYQNNSKYYANEAEAAAARAEAAVPSGTAGAVFFDRAQSLTAAQQAQARANIMAGGSNPNLFDNGWFRIHQRGTTNGTSGFIADRWATTFGSGGNTWSRTSETITLQSTNGTSHADIFQYLIDPMSKAIAGKQCTISIMLEDKSVYSRTFSFPVYGQGLTAQTIWNRSAGPIQFRIVYTYSMTRVEIWVWNEPATLRAVKLELGTTSTLANDAPPNEMDMLDRCQHYLLPLRIQRELIGRANTSSIATFDVPWHRGRTAQSLEGTYTLYVRGAGISQTPTGLTISYYTDDYIRLQATGLSGLTSNMPLFLRIETGTLLISTGI